MHFFDIRFTFMCRTSHQNAEGQNPIVLRIKYGGACKDLFTGIYCQKQNFFPKQQRIGVGEPNAKIMNENLELILRKAMADYDELRFSRESFTVGELVEKMKGKEKKPTLLIDFLEEGNLRVSKRVGKEILRVTYIKYQRSLRYMKQFLMAEYKVKNFSLLKVNTAFLERFFDYLLHVQGVAHNTACKYMMCIKTTMAPAIRDGHIPNNPFQGIKLAAKPVYRGYLSQEEIDKLANLQDLEPHLELKRDVFLFSCYTGLAFIDLQQLSRANLIREADDSWYVRKPRQKTGQDSIIPLLPAAMRILAKYSPTDSIADFKWKVGSNTKLNLGLKVLAQKAGIDKYLHMHLARHTFATTVTLSNGVPIESVSRMLGHASIKQTQQYAKVVPMKLKGDMEKIRGLFK